VSGDSEKERGEDELGRGGNIANPEERVGDNSGGIGRGTKNPSSRVRTGGKKQKKKNSVVERRVENRG